MQTFTEHEIKRAIDLLYALGYGNVCGDMGDDEIRDMMINVGGWVQWLVDNGHLVPDG